MHVCVLLQWRSEGVGRPGAKCTNGAPPLAQDHSPLEFGQIRIPGEGGGSPSSLAKSDYFPLRLTTDTCTWIRGGSPCVWPSQGRIQDLGAGEGGNDAVAGHAHLSKRDLGRSPSRFATFALLKLKNIA